MANESDMILVATTMQNSDIVDGVDYIFKESERLGRPCVVNLSLGDGIGGHDGTNFMDIINFYRRVGDHLTNIIEGYTDK